MLVAADCLSISRLTLESASRQIVFRMNARSLFHANEGSDDSDLA